jgi:hypothetical protein
MQESLEAIHTALRVLQAIIERRHPDPADVQELRRLAPLLRGLDTDELAREVILMALKRQRQKQAKKSDEAQAAANAQS